jgi:hypothetical protein
MLLSPSKSPTTLAVRVRVAETGPTSLSTIISSSTASIPSVYSLTWETS